MNSEIAAKTLRQLEEAVEAAAKRLAAADELPLELAYDETRPMARGLAYNGKPRFWAELRFARTTDGIVISVVETWVGAPP